MFSYSAEKKICLKILTENIVTFWLRFYYEILKELYSAEKLLLDFHLKIPFFLFFQSKFLKDLGLGGGMIWALDLDDFRNRCGCGKHPLLKTLNYELRGLPSDITVDNCT